MNRLEMTNYHRDKDYLKFERTFRNIFQKRLSLLNRFLPKTGRVLDIGCSTGVFLDLFKDPTSPRLRGAQWETWGVEPSSSAKCAEKKGHKIINECFEKSQLPKNYFDLAILNHTLEHMGNPLEVLQKVNTILKKDGLIYVDVPNYGGLSSKILGKRWPLLLPNEHKWQFTKRSLTRILRKTGFKVMAWQSRSGIFEYAHPFKELYRKRFLIDLLTSPYALIATVFNKGDSISLVAKKI